jgi:hypothetical protein
VLIKEVSKYFVMSYPDMPQPLTFGTKNTQMSFPVPQSVQKVKNVKFHKLYGIIEQEK